MMSVGWRLIVLGPGGDDSSSGGGNDLGAAQHSQEVWTNTDKWMKRRALGTKGLDTVHMAHLIDFESEKELLIHQHEDGLGQ